MTPTATAVYAGALDAALHDHPARRGDLAREIMLRLHWLHDRRGLDAMQAMSGGRILGPDHLVRLRLEWQTR